MAEDNQKKYLDSLGLVRLVANIMNKYATKADVESGTIVVKEAEHADTADTATNATNAVNAENANHAASADTATNANHATTADSATKATNAENADKADYATEAGNANYAASAGNANTAASATKATQDGNGKVISDTYETKADASSKLDTAKAYTDKEIAALDEIVDLKADITDFNESIIALSVSGTTVTYVKGDGTTHTFETQDTDTTYSLGTDEVTGLTKLYATTGSAEDGTMTQKAIKTELDKKVGVTIDSSQNALVFTK